MKHYGKNGSDNMSDLKRNETELTGIIGLEKINILRDFKDKKNGIYIEIIILKLPN
ncbi:hypothetical protein OLP61_03475 [Campylobacter jejuni]|nr:hypothetical protein [Campylobacter jejuni]